MARPSDCRRRPYSSKRVLVEVLSLPASCKHRGDAQRMRVITQSKAAQGGMTDLEDADYDCSRSVHATSSASSTSCWAIADTLADEGRRRTDDGNESAGHVALIVVCVCLVVRYGVSMAINPSPHTMLTAARSAGPCIASTGAAQSAARPFSW